MSSAQPPFLVDDDNGDVAGFVSLSLRHSVRLHVRPSISDEEAIPMIGGVDMRQETGELDRASDISLVAANTSADAGTVPMRAYIVINSDDVNESDYRRSIVGVASTCPINAMYYHSYPVMHN